MLVICDIGKKCGVVGCLHKTRHLWNDISCGVAGCTHSSKCNCIDVKLATTESWQEIYG